jgi:putative ABC transport system substrate-binding protein
MDIRYAEGRTERYAELAAELVRLKPDVIVAVSTPGAVAAKNATTAIPIVMLAVSDPVGTGLVPNLARPGGNITGLSLLAPELSAKRVDLLKQTLPQLSRLAVLWNVQNQGMHLRFREVNAAAPPLGIHVLSFGVRHPTEFDDAFAAMRRDHPQALLVMADTVTASHRHRTVEFADANRLPAIYESREFVDAGGLMSYGINFVEHYRQGAVYVDRILKGQRPADLAVQQPSRFEFIVNQRSARAIGLTIPPALLLRADQLID